MWSPIHTWTTKRTFLQVMDRRSENKGRLELEINSDRKFNCKRRMLENGRKTLEEEEDRQLLLT